MLPKINCSICDKVILVANLKLHFNNVHDEKPNDKKKKKLNDPIMDYDEENKAPSNADKVEEKISETKKLKILNSILKKELREAKDEIASLKQENEVLTAEYGKLQDLSEELIAQNITLKNGQSSDQDENISVDDVVKNENVKVEVHKGRKNQHMIVHGGHKCNLCDKKFAQSCSLSRHFKKAHKNYKKLNPENNAPPSSQTSDKKSKSTMSLNSKIHTMLMNLAPIPDQDMKADKILLDKLYYKCDECEKSFRNKFRLKRHKNSVHRGIKNHLCSFCDYRSSRRDALKLHISTHEGLKEGRHKCSLCDKHFAQSCSLYRHLKKSHKNEKLVLDKFETSKSNKIISDQKSTASNQEKIMHADDKSLQDKIFTCDSCEKCFAKKSKLDRHINGVHKGIKNHRCLVCDHKFFQYSNLKQHMLRVHEKLKNYICDLCDKSFFHSPSLRRHYKKVHKIQKLVAENRSFEKDGISQITDQKILNNEELSSSVNDSKKYKCELCVKYFSYLPSLNRHFKKVHKNEKLVAKNDAHPSDQKIEKHMKSVHVGQKRHKCDSCSKSFDGIHELRRHIKSAHDGVKDHICKLCNKFFVRSDVLKKHVKEFHDEESSAKGGKTLKCKFCTKMFTRMFSLKRHIATTHEN